MARFMCPERVVMITRRQGRGALCGPTDGDLARAGERRRVPHGALARAMCRCRCLTWTHVCVVVRRPRCVRSGGSASESSLSESAYNFGKLVAVVCRVPPCGVWAQLMWSYRRTVQARAWGIADW